MHATTSSDHGRLSIRFYEPGDETRILQTFNLVFRKECGAGFVARRLDHWRWQYLDNPAGTQILLAVAADGTIAAQYAAVPQLADTERGQLRFVHVVDSMTHPEYRQGLKQQGLFATLGNRFTENHDEHGNEIGYGLPVRVAERIGRRLLDYTLLRVIDYWMRDPASSLPEATEGVRVTASEGVPTGLDALWQRCRPARPCTVRKDARYLEWRYAQGPMRDEYLRLAAWRDGQLVGFLALRPRHDLVPDACTVADLVCHDDDDDAARALLACACRIASERGRTLLGVFAPHDPHVRRLQAIGCRPQPSTAWLERRLTYRITGPHVTPDDLEHRWRYSLGDTDLC